MPDENTCKALGCPGETKCFLERGYEAKCNRLPLPPVYSDYPTRKRGIIFGWRCGDETQTQIYHTHCKKWSNSTTYDIREAFVFKDLKEARQWFEKINLEQFWASWDNGEIQFFDASTFQMIII